MGIDQVNHEVAPGGPGADLIHEVHPDPWGEIIRHRHKEWRGVPMCQHCLKNHVWSHLVRYPMAAVGNEVCECPCRKQVAA